MKLFLKRLDLNFKKKIDTASGRKARKNPIIQMFSGSSLLRLTSLSDP